MKPDLPHADRFDLAVRSVITNPQLRDSAATVQQIEAMPADADLAVEIEALTSD